MKQLPQDHPLRKKVAQAEQRHRERVEVAKDAGIIRKKKNHEKEQ